MFPGVEHQSNNSNEGTPSVKQGAFSCHNFTHDPMGSYEQTIAESSRGVANQPGRLRRVGNKPISPSNHDSGARRCSKLNVSSNADQRSRDLLDSLPLFATERGHLTELKSRNRRTQQIVKRQHAAERVANDMIRALQALHHGSVRPATSFGSSVRSVEGFEQSRGHH